MAGSVRRREVHRRQRGTAYAGLRPTEEGRDRGRVGRRVGWQQERRPRWLVEVEVVDQVAELWHVLPHVGTGIGAPVRLRVEPGAAEEVVLDELQEGVAAERLMVDDALLGVGGDDDPRDAQPVAVV